MKINVITVYQLTLPHTKPYRLSGGRLLFEELDSTFVRIDTAPLIPGLGVAPELAVLGEPVATYS